MRNLENKTNMELEEEARRLKKKAEAIKEMREMAKEKGVLSAEEEKELKKYEGLFNTQTAMLKRIVELRKKECERRWRR